MPALYFYLRDNDDDDNGQITPSANNDDYHSYKQVLVITLLTLTTAFKNAPTKNLKIQILSLYVLNYSTEELKKRAFREAK